MTPPVARSVLGQQRKRRAWPLKRTKRLKFWLPTMPKYSAKKAMSEPNGIAVYSCAGAARQQPPRHRLSALAAKLPASWRA
jgi:hypothetical protein